MMMADTSIHKRTFNDTPHHEEHRGQHTRPPEHVVEGVHVDPRKDEERDSHLQGIVGVKMAAAG